MTFPDLFFSFRLLASGGCHSQSPAHTELQPLDSLLSHLPTPSFATSINLLLCSSSRPPGLPVPTSAPSCWYFHRPYIGHLSLASLFLSAKPQRTHAIPVLYLIPPTLVTPNRKRNIWISAAFGLSPNKTTVLISSLFPFYHSFHPFIHFLYLWLLCLLQNTADTFPPCSILLFSTLSGPGHLTLNTWDLSPSLSQLPAISPFHLCLSSPPSTFFQLSLQITMSSANTIVHGDTCLASSVRLVRDAASPPPWSPLSHL